MHTFLETHSSNCQIDYRALLHPTHSIPGYKKCGTQTHAYAHPESRILSSCLNPHDFNLMLIPHTQNNIIMPTKKVGALVNLEPDVIAKYVQRVVESVGSGAAHAELVQRLGAVERSAAQGARRLVLGVAIGAAVGALIGAFVTKRA